MTLRYEFTKSDYISAQRAHCWRRFRPREAEFILRFNPVFGVVLIVLGFIFLRWPDVRWAAWVEFVAGAYLIASRPLANILLSRHYHRTRMHTGEMTISFENDAIYSSFPGTASSQIQYSTIKSLRPTPDHIMIYLAPAVFIAVPRRAMSADQQTELISFLEARKLSS